MENEDEEGPEGKKMGPGDGAARGGEWERWIRTSVSIPEENWSTQDEGAMARRVCSGSLLGIRRECPP